LPFYGQVQGETPLARNEPEVRRRDIGTQRFGHGLHKRRGEFTETFQTSHGPMSVAMQTEPDRGYMPSADVVNFLRSEYVGSRQPLPPPRFFPL